jgi:hypothetical protein
MFDLSASPESAGMFIWTVSLVLGLVVTGVVTFLLWIIHKTAVDIDNTASSIWDTGQRVANNTVHIPILYRINNGAEKILATALEINDGAAGIEAHANGCPGCPGCIIDHAKAGGA